MLSIAHSPPLGVVKKSFGFLAYLSPFASWENFRAGRTAPVHVHIEINDGRWRRVPRVWLTRGDWSGRFHPPRQRVQPGGQLGAEG